MSMTEVQRLVRGESDYWVGERYLNMVRHHSRWPHGAEQAEAELIQTLQMSWSMLRCIDSNVDHSADWVDGICGELRKLKNL